MEAPNRFQKLVAAAKEQIKEISPNDAALEHGCGAATLIDVRGKEAAYPDLTSRTSYAFTHRAGRYVHEQDLNGLLARSARCDGTNAAIFKPERLSNVRDRTYLTYRLNVVRDTLVAERATGRKWLTVSPSTLG